MHTRRILGLIMVMAWAAAWVAPARAQQDGVLQLDDTLYDFLLRQQTAGRLSGAFLTHQPLAAHEAQRHLDSLALRPDALSRVDRLLLARFRGTAPAPGARWVNRLLGFLYTDGNAYVSVRGDDYALQLQPLATAYYGQARQTARAGREASVSTWGYARGARLSGHLGRHLFFDTQLTENVWQPVRIAFDRPTDTAPRYGFVKNPNGGDSYNRLSATGVVGLRTKYVEARFGKDRYRWGPGIGSVLLSDYATAYDHLQLRTTVWRFQYTNLFAGLTEPSLRTRPNVAVPRKYAAFHRLAVDLPGRVQVGVFESIIFAADTLGARTGFDLSYANPLIFYRAAEHDRGSPDNALLGIDASWIVVPRVQVYGQLLFDELVVSEIGKGWWGNKWAWLVGAHLVELPVRDLSLRLEWTRLRPYLYGHQTPATSYTHYSDLLGHPAGPNAVDLSVFADYRPAPRLHAALTLSYTRRGRNTDTENFGADPLDPYTSRHGGYDQNILQGVRQTHLLVEAWAGYELFPAFYVEAALRAERIDDAEDGLDRYVAPFVQLRWGLPFERMRF